MKTEFIERIKINPLVGHGKPTIRNTRYLVESILEYLSGGDTPDEIIKAFPDLEKEDILAAVAYATEVLKHKSISFSMAK